MQSHFDQCTNAQNKRIEAAEHRRASKPKGIKLSAAMAGTSLFALLLLWIFFTPTKFDRESYLASCCVKHRILKEIVTPKVILVGGSNLATGLDSALLEQRLKRKVVNMGTCVQVGLGYMLREIVSETNADDIVVVFPEYEHWVDQFNGEKYLLMLPALIPDSIAWITPSYLSPTFSITRIGNDFASITQKRARQRVPLSFTSTDPVDQAILYRYPGFNERGDFIAHLDLPGKSIDSKQPSLADFSHPNPAAIDAFNKIVGKIQNKGAKVLLFPPVTTSSFARLRKLQLDRFYKELSMSINAEVIGDYNRYALADDYFYDCIYHVRRVGRKVRTELVAENLKPVIQNQLSMKKPF